MPQRNKSSARAEYEHAKEEIDRRFPVGRFVAVEAGHIVADGASHSELVEKLGSLGKSPHGMLIVQAGGEYPDSAMILVTSHGRAANA